MSTLSKPEAYPGQDEPEASPQSAQVIDLQEYLREHRPIADLGEVAIGEVPRVAVDDTEKIERLYHPDWQRVKAAENDPQLLDDLSKEFKGFIRLIASGYFLTGGDSDDLVQEGFHGFLKAVKDYDGQSSSFKSFAELCIRRNIITAIKAATRHKHEPLNRALSFSHTPAGYDDGSDFTLGDALPSPRPLPEDVVIGDEMLDGLTDIISQLSPMERGVIKMVIEDRSYEEMAVLLGTDEKAIDNAIQRAKRKIRLYLERYNRGSVIIKEVLPLGDVQPRPTADATPNKVVLSLKDVVIASEAFGGLDVLSSRLTDLEFSALKMHIDGKNYKTIAGELGIQIVAVNNALARAKRKTLELLERHVNGHQVLIPHKDRSLKRIFALEGLTDVISPQLTDRQALILRMCLEGKSNQTIANELGIHVAAVASSLYRVKRIAVKYLDDNEQ